MSACAMNQLWFLSPVEFLPELLARVVSHLTTMKHQKVITFEISQISNDIKHHFSFYFNLLSNHVKTIRYGKSVINHIQQSIK